MGQSPEVSTHDSMTAAEIAKYYEDSDRRFEARMAAHKATPIGVGLSKLYANGREVNDVIAVNKDSIAATVKGKTELHFHGSVMFDVLYHWLLRFERWPYEPRLSLHAMQKGAKA